MNLPNKLTVLRVCTIPFFVFFMETECLGRWSSFVAVLLFVFASITDALDGKIARKYNLITNFGKFMDPLADKLLVSAALICLVGRIPSWIVVVIISRELIISGFRTIAADNGIVIAASMWGKVKTTIQMIAIMLILLDPNNFFDFAKGIEMNQYAFIYNIVTSVGMLAATAITIISGWDYLSKGKDLFKNK